ncbi:hypothetical protein [Sphingomonas melonis]|jgi:hypothetical protein|uniref:hypothetical protein n=1 Tax=Sphingomonas melonis TaxID=152682 RepID=UPI0003A9C185|nr:hypothetical protein [Sphingomonas melonis]
MKKIALALMALTVTTPAMARDVDAVLSKPAKDTVVTTMTVDQLSTCLMSKNVWGSPMLIDGPEGKRFAATDSGFVSFVLTMTPVDGGTRVERRGQPLGSQLLKRCVA